MKTEQNKTNKLSRLKFYTLLLFINVLFVLMFNLLLSYAVSICQQQKAGECMGIGILLLFTAIAMPFLSAIVNLIVVLIYEFKKRKDRKNRFIIIIFILIMYAGLSGIIFENPFLISETMYDNIDCDNLNENECGKYHNKCLPVFRTIPCDNPNSFNCPLEFLNCSEK